ncbi:unnamed protein product [Spodoptera exigua]|nr:unnamed protein product [Spodoptera exigua]
MEGDGEGMVAIVQGLDSAGVTLTVVNRTRQNPDRRRSSRPRIQFDQVNPNSPRSSVQTSTERTRKSDTGVQICDGRYASSYKMAHCMVSPTSPPEGVSEFPPQRKKPCRNQRAPKRANRPLQMGPYGADVQPELGGLLRRSWSSRQTEAFVHSLRKYPSVTGRTVSTDLIERLLKYTQSMNSSRTRPSRSMRSLHEDASSGLHDSSRVSKHQQTYTRRPKDGPTGPIGYKGRSRNFRLYSPVSECRHVRESLHREPKFSSSYDYLRAGSPRNRSDGSPSPSGSRSPTQPTRPIRYERPVHSVRDMSLSDVSKYIRSTIRQIYRERPFVFQVCPRLMNRYHQHKKFCPVQNDENVEPSGGKQADGLPDGKQSAPPMDTRNGGDTRSRSLWSQFLPARSSCSEPKFGHSVGFQCNGTNCSCSKSIQCSCYPDAATNTSLTNLQAKKPKHFCCPKMAGKTASATCVCLDKINKIPIKCSCNNDDEIYYNRRIDEEISDWLKHVPVQSIESYDTKRKRDSMVRQFRNTLRTLRDNEDFDDNVTTEVKSFMEDFPIWNPGTDKKDKMQFKEKLSDNLIGRITSVRRKPDQFRDIVRKWARENVEFEDSLDDAEKEAYIDNIVNQLKHLAANRPDNDAEYKEILKKEIIEMMKELPLKVKDNRDAAIDKWASILATDTASIPENEDLSDVKTDLTLDLEDSLEGLLNELGIIREALQQIKDDPKALQILAKRLNKLQAQGIDDDSIREKMENEIRKFMDDLGIAQETIDELVGELMNQVNDIVQTSQLENENIEELHGIVDDWLNSIPGIDKISQTKIDKISRDLVTAIKEAKEEGKENIEDEVLSRIDEAGLPIDADTIRKQIPDLVNKVDLWPINELYDDQSKQILLDEINGIIDAANIPEGKKQLVKDRLKKVLDHDIKDASILDVRQVQNHLKEDMGRAISEGGISYESQSDLLDKLSKAVSRNCFKSFIGLGRYIPDLKQSAKKYIREALDEVPINGRKKKELIDKVKNTLDKNINKQLPNDIENTIAEEICCIVEESPVCEDENIAKYLKCLLSSISTKVFDLFTCKNNCVCHIQRRLENDLCKVIDRCPIDCNKKRELKRNIRDILTENENRRLSEDAKQAVKEDIISVVSDISIPEDKKNSLKSSISETISQDFDDAIAGLEHDISKVKQKIFNHLNKAIENSPVSFETKEYLHTKLKRMLDEKFDTSLTNEKKNLILDDVSDIVQDVIPENKRTKLRNKLANKLDSQDNENAFTEAIKKSLEQNIKDIIEKASIPKETKNDLKMQLTDILDNNEGESMAEVKVKIKGKIFDIIDESPIAEEKQRALKRDLLKILTNKMGGTSVQRIGMDNYKRKITNEISELIAKLPISETEKSDMNNEINKTISNRVYRPLTDDVKTAIKKDINNIVKETDIPEKPLKNFKSKLEMALKIHLDVPRDVHKDTDVIKEDLRQNLSRAVDELTIANDKKRSLKIKLKDALVKNIDRKMTDKIQQDITKDIGTIIDNSTIPDKISENKVLDIKDKVADIVAGLHLDEYMREYVVNDWIKKILTKDLEDVIDTIPTDSKNITKVKNDVEKMLVHSLYLPMTDTIKHKIRREIINVVDKMGIDDEENSDVKVRISSALAKGMDKKVCVGKDLGQIKSALQQIIKEGIENASIPEYTQDLLAQESEDILNDNLIRPITDEIKTDIHEKIETILEDVSVKNDKYVRDDFQEDIEQIVKGLSAPALGENKVRKISISIDDSAAGEMQDKELTRYIEKLGNETQKSILSQLRKAIDAAPIYADKKTESKKMLLNIGKDYFDTTLTEDSLNQLKDDLFDILDELQLPKETSAKMSQQLSDLIDELMESLTSKSMVDPLENVKVNVLHAITNTVNDATIPKNKKLELKSQLTEMAARVINNTPLEKIQDALRDGADDILDDYPLIRDKKIKLRRDLEDSIEENLSSSERDYPKIRTKLLSREVIPDSQIKKEEETLLLLEEIKRKRTKKSILQGVEEIIGTSRLPIKKKEILKEKLNKTIDKIVRSSVFKDLEDDLKSGICNVLHETVMFESDRNKIKDNLLYMINQRMKDILRFSADDNDMEGKLLQNFLNKLENALNDSLIPTSKKNILKNKLKILSDTGFTPPFSQGAQNIILDGVDTVLNEMFSKIDGKIFRNELLDIISSGKNKGNVQEEIKPKRNKVFNNINNGATQPNENREENEPKTIYDFFKALENEIYKSPVFKRKKVELNIYLQKITNDFLDNSWSEDVKDDLRHGISKILDELYLSRVKKHRLKTNFERLIVEPSETTSNPGSWKDMKDIQKKPLEIFFHKLEETIDDSLIPIGKNQLLKKKLKDLFSSGFKQQFNRKQRNVVCDILEALPLSEQEKNKYLKELDDIYGVIWIKGNLKERLIDKEKYDSFFHKFERIIDENLLPEYKKKLLKRKLKDVSTSGLSEPVSSQWRNGVYSILETLILSKEEKKGLLKELGDMLFVDLITEHENESPRSFAIRTSEADDRNSDQLFLSDEHVITKARESIVKNIERRIEEALMPESKKAKLMERLKTLASNKLQQPLCEDGCTYVREDLGDIINVLPIDGVKKIELVRVVEKNIELLNDLHKNKDNSHKQIQENIISALYNIVNETLMVEEKKKDLKKKLGKLVENTFEEVSPDILHGALIDGVNDIVNETGIAKTKRDKLKFMLMEAIDDNIGALRDDEIDTTEDSTKNNAHEVPLRQFNEIKTRTIEINTDLVPFDTIDNLGTTTKKERNNEKLPVLQIEVETETLDELTTDNLLMFAEDNNDDDTADLIEDIPLDQAKKHKSTEVGLTLVKHPGKWSSKEQSQMQNTLKVLETTIDDSLLTAKQKVDLKEKLKIILSKNYRIQLKDDLRDTLKAEINLVLNEMPLTSYVKNKLEHELLHSLDCHLSHLQKGNYINKLNEDRLEPSSCRGLRKDELYTEKHPLEVFFHKLEQIIDEKAIPTEKIKVLKEKLKYLSSASFEQPFTGQQVNVVNNILDVLQMPEEEKNRYLKELAEVLDKVWKVDKESAKTTSTLCTAKQGLRSSRIPSLVYESSIIKAIERVLAEIELKVKEIPMPISKRINFMGRLEKITSDDLQGALSEGKRNSVVKSIGNIIEDLPVDEVEKYELKRKVDINITCDKSLDEESREKPTDNPRQRWTFQKYPQLSKSMDENKKNFRNLTMEIGIPTTQKETNTSLEKYDDNKTNSRLSTFSKATDMFKPRESIVQIIEHKHSRRKRNKDLADDDDDYQANDKTFTHSSYTEESDISTKNNDLTPRDTDTRKRAKENIINELENKIKEALISRRKRAELIKQLQKVSDSMETPLSESQKNHIVNDLTNIVEQLAISGTERDELTLSINDNMEHLMDKSLRMKELKLLDKTIENSIHGFDEVIDKSLISSKIKTDLKKCLEHLVNTTFNQASPSTKITSEDFKYAVFELLDMLITSKNKKNILREELFKRVDENFERYENELKELLGQETNGKDAEGTMKDTIIKSVEQSSIGDDTKQKIRRELSEMLKSVLIEDKNRNDDDDNSFSSLIGDFKLDPEYEAELKQMEDELAKVILEGGDLDAAKERLIEKIMMETGLSREQATELVNRLHAKTNMDNKDNFKELIKTFGLNPEYEKELKRAEDELTKVILEGGDVEAAKENLIKKIMEETGLSREQAAELVNKLYENANKNKHINNIHETESKGIDDETTKTVLEEGVVDEINEKLNKEMNEPDLARVQAVSCNVDNKAEQTFNKKRRRKSPSRAKRRITAKSVIEKIKEPLKEEISDILIKHKVRPTNTNKLIEDIFSRLDDLTANGGYPFDATTSCNKTLSLQSHVSGQRTRKTSKKPVKKAKKISLKTKEQIKMETHSVEEPKQRSINKTKKTFIVPEETGISKIKRPASAHVNLIAKTHRESDDVSTKTNGINIPKDYTHSLIKDEIEDALYRNIKHILIEAAIPPNWGNKLRDTNLKNVVDKDSDKSKLKKKKDVDMLKQLVLQDVYDVIDNSPNTKNDNENLKSKQRETVDTKLNETELIDGRVQKERLTEKVDDVASQVPTSSTETHKFKNTYTTIYSETEQLKINTLPPYQKKSSESKKSFAPIANSTFKNDNDLEIIEEMQATDTAQKTVENIEKDYTEEVTEIIKAWLEEIPLEIEVSAKEQFIKELANDIIDRKNIFHAPVKLLFAEDLEYLKKQILKRTTDLLTPDIQKLVLGKCKGLLKKINEIQVPAVTDPSGPVPQTLSQSEMEEEKAALPSAKVLKALQDSLLREMDTFLSPLDITTEGKEKLKRKLLVDLDRLLKNETDPDIIMQHLIATIKRVTNMSNEEAVELARRLMNKTKEMGFLPKVCCQPRRLSFATDAICVPKKAFRDAILEEIGDPFLGCHISEQKKMYLEDLLIEDYAKEFGITLTECCPRDDVGDENDVPTLVNDWISTIPVTMRNDQDYTTFVQEKNNLIQKITESLPTSNFGKIREDAANFLLNIPLHSDLRENVEQQNKKVEDLINKFLCLPPKAKGRRYGMSFSGLTDYIDSWIDNIHISDDTKDDEAMKDMKKGMTYSLVHKLGEMNIDPEIFNNNLLYEEVLRDELQNLLDDVTITDDNLQALKDDLIDKVKSAQQRAHDEIIGQNYKHQLRHAMTDILPAPCTMSRDEQAAMELLKDQLADAFIDLNYSGNDETLKTQLKRKIADEIRKFCDNYLSSHPAAPLSDQQLNFDLFNALASVPLPLGDSIRYEVEQARIREVINEWIKELPLQPQNHSELLARNRLIYILSKKLFDIETEAEDAPDELMRKEIIKLLNKMPLSPGNDINQLANDLIEKLNSSKESRRFDDSSDDIDAYRNICDSSCPIKGKGSVPSRYRRIATPQEKLCYKRKTFPPCTLSLEDRAYLDKIRRRSCVTPNCVKALLRNDKCNAAVGPQPADAQSQTELKTRPVCTGVNENMTRPCLGMTSPRRSPCSLRRHTVSSSRIQVDQEEVQPQVAVKKYYWDSAQKSNFQDSESQPNRAPYSSSFSPPRPATCHPPDCQRPTSYQRPVTPPFRGTQPNTVPCQAGTPPYKKSSQSPYHRDCYKHNNQQQSTSPHSVPCNYDHSISHGAYTKPTKPVGRFYHWSPQRSFQEKISQSSQRSTPRSRSPAQSPCISRSPSPCGLNHESTPLNCRGKRNGLQEPCTSSRPSRKERVTELGSLDDLQHPRANKNKSSSFDWSYAQFPEDDSFWGTPCMRRVILDEGIDEPLMMEREEREERVTCKCKERLFPKAMRTSCMIPPRDQESRNGNNLRRCSKCCGMHCPFPSFLYFRE